jgi:hypothetical protein
VGTAEIELLEKLTGLKTRHYNGGKLEGIGGERERKRKKPHP